MQNRYAADVGDYVKFAILRRLQPGRSLGVLWWLHPDESHNADGKHITYLEHSGLWRSLEPSLFDGLKKIVSQRERSVSTLQQANFLPLATYFAEPIPTVGRSPERRSARHEWFARGRATVASCDLVFLDPDNGLETSRFDPGRSGAGKSVALSELEALRQPGRTLIVYHHQTRRAGGHQLEMAHWGTRLASLGFKVDALRAAVGTARAFFLLDADAGIRAAAAELARHWGQKLTWHPGLG